MEWLLGVIGVPIAQYIKNKLGLSGIPALLAAGLVSVVLAIVFLFVDGGMPALSWDNFSAVFGAVFSAATLVYKGLLPLIQGEG